MFLPDSINKDTWLVLWSAKQHLFHVETIQDHLEAGQQAFIHKMNPSYFPIAMFNDREQANQHVEYLRESGTVFYKDI